MTSLVVKSPVGTVSSRTAGLRQKGAGRYSAPGPKSVRAVESAGLNLIR